MSAFPTTPPIVDMVTGWSFPSSECHRLSNGVEVQLLRRTELPLVHLRLETRGGRWLTTSPAQGRLASAVARHGTLRFDSGELAARQDGLGAHLGASAGVDAQQVTAFGLSEHLDALVEMLAQVALFPTFPVHEVTRIAQQASERRRHSLVQPASRAGEWLASGLYGLEHPYGRRRPSAEDYVSRTREELAAFHALSWQPESSMIFAVGDVTMERLIPRLESELGGWAQTSDHPPVPGAATKRSSARIIAIDRPGSEQATVRVGFQALPRSAPNFMSARVMNHVLGGGASARLFQDLRESRSLTYACSSSLDAARFGGDLVAGLACSHENLPEAMVGLRENLDRIAVEAVPSDELAAARDYLVGSFPNAGSSIAGLSQLLAARWRHRLPSDIWAGYTQAVRSVTAAEILDAAQEIIRMDRAVVVVVGEGETVARVLAEWGDVEEVDMSTPIV